MNTIINILSSNSGVFVRWITSLIIAGLTAALARIGFNLDPKDTAELSTITGLVVGGLLAEWINKRQNKTVSSVQERLQGIAPEVVVDGHAGPITEAALSRAVEVVQKIGQDGVDGTKAERAAAKSAKLAMEPEPQPKP